MVFNSSLRNGIVNSLLFKWGIAFACGLLILAYVVAPDRLDNSPIACEVHTVQNDGALFHLRKHLTIDGSFGGLTSLDVDAMGRIYSADFVKHEIIVVGPNGKVLHRLGREGKGPGEFAGLRDLGVVRDSLYVFDNTLKRITVYSLTERPAIEYTIPLPAKTGYVANYGVLANKFGGILAQYVPLTRPVRKNGRNIQVRRIDRQGPNASIIVVPDREWLIMQHPEYGNSVSPLPFGGESLLRFGPDGKIYHIRTDIPEIHIYGYDGRRIACIGLSLDPLPVTENDLLALRASYIEYVGEQAGALVYGRVERAYELGLIPEYKPLFKDFLVSDAGLIWLRLITTQDDLESTPVGLVFRVSDDERSHSNWIILSQDGQYVGEARVNADVRLMVVKNGNAYGWSTNSLGVDRIVVYEITR